MGYNTRYTLEWSPRSPRGSAVEEYIRQRQQKDENFAYAIDSDGRGEESLKWYDHEEDIKLLSMQFPNILFTLSGEGEEPGDLWKKYFKNGKMQVAKAQITFAPFNPKELK